MDAVGAGLEGGLDVVVDDDRHFVAKRDANDRQRQLHALGMRQTFGADLDDVHTAGNQLSRQLSRVAFIEVRGVDEPVEPRLNQRRLWRRRKVPW